MTTGLDQRVDKCMLNWCMDVMKGLASRASPLFNRVLDFQLVPAHWNQTAATAVLFPPTFPLLLAALVLQGPLLFETRSFLTLQLLMVALVTLNILATFFVEKNKWTQPTSCDFTVEEVKRGYLRKRFEEHMLWKTPTFTEQYNSSIQWTDNLVFWSSEQSICRVVRIRGVSNIYSKKSDTAETT